MYSPPPSQHQLAAVINQGLGGDPPIRPEILAQTFDISTGDAPKEEEEERERSPTPRTRAPQRDLSVPRRLGAREARLEAELAALNVTHQKEMRTEKDATELSEQNIQEMSRQFQAKIKRS